MDSLCLVALVFDSSVFLTVQGHSASLSTSPTSWQAGGLWVGGCASCGWSPTTCSAPRPSSASCSSATIVSSQSPEQWVEHTVPKWLLAAKWFSAIGRTWEISYLWKKMTGKIKLNQKQGGVCSPFAWSHPTLFFVSTHLTCLDFKGYCQTPWFCLPCEYLIVPSLWSEALYLLRLIGHWLGHSHLISSNVPICGG